MKMICNVPDEVIKSVRMGTWCGSSVVEKMIANGTPIPDNATNGDVIKAMFPYDKYNEYFADVEMKTEENDTRFKSIFDRDWWDKPYQKGGTNEKQV